MVDDLVTEIFLLQKLKIKRRCKKKIEKNNVRSKVLDFADEFVGSDAKIDIA